MTTAIHKLLRIIFALFVFAGFLFGCIGKFGDKSLAVDKTKAQLKQQLRQEIDLKVDKHENFKSNYVGTIVDLSDIEVLEIKQIGNRKVAVVKVGKVPITVRQPLMEIIGKTEEWKENKFNISDAIKLIYQQLGLPLDQLETATYEVILD